MKIFAVITQFWTLPVHNRTVLHISSFLFCDFLDREYTNQIKSKHPSKKIGFSKKCQNFVEKSIFWGKGGIFGGKRAFLGGEWGFFGENVEFSEKYRIFGKMLDSRKHVEFLEKCGIFGFLEKCRIFLVKCDFDWLGHKESDTGQTHWDCTETSFQQETPSWK